MFPFKCHEFQFEIGSNATALKLRLQNDPVINKSRSGFDWELTGTVQGNSANLRTVQKFHRNPFRPEAKVSWKDDNTLLVVEGHFKVATIVTVATLLSPLFGLYLSIKTGSLIPVVLTGVIWILIFGTIGRYAFERDLKSVRDKVFGVLNVNDSRMQEKFLSLEWRLQNLKLMQKYFHSHSIEQPLFIPEYEICKDIVEVLALPDKQIEEKLQDCSNCYNRILNIEHYDGTGWYDFQIRLNFYFAYFGYKLDFDKASGRMTFKSATS